MNNYVTLHTTRFGTTYNDDILPDMQDALARLADLDMEFDLECSALDRLTVPEIVRQRLRRRLDRAHTEARQSHVSLLADLHQEMTFSTMFGPGITISAS
jgi:hypothetical protein